MFWNRSLSLWIPSILILFITVRLSVQWTTRKISNRPDSKFVYIEVSWLGPCKVIPLLVLPVPGFLEFPVPELLLPAPIVLLRSLNLLVLLPAELLEELPNDEFPGAAGLSWEGTFRLLLGIVAIILARTRETRAVYCSLVGSILLWPQYQRGGV